MQKVNCGIHFFHMQNGVGYHMVSFHSSIPQLTHVFCIPNFTHTQLNHYKYRSFQNKAEGIKHTHRISQISDVNHQLVML